MPDSPCSSTTCPIPSFTCSQRSRTTVDHMMSSHPGGNHGHESHRLHGTIVWSKEEEHVMVEYTYPEMLVSTEWVAQHRHDPTVRIVESDEDILLYDVGHIPSAIKVDWQSELQHQVIRDYIDKDAFAKLVGSKGISNDHTVVFYGDRNNWWACYALWVFKMYGHRDCRIMNGGRQKWIDEGRELSPERPNYPATTYTASGPALRIRAF